MIAFGAISIELSEELVPEGAVDAFAIWTTIRNVLSKESSNAADETDVTTQAELKEMARVVLDLAKSGASWEVVIVRSLAKWLGMKGLRRIAAKLYASFIEWFCENDDEQLQLHDFARYVGAFMEFHIVMVILRYMPPLLGVKVVGVCGLLVGVAFLLRLAQMAYKRCTTRSSMDVSAASEPYVHVDILLNEAAGDVMTSQSDEILDELRLGNGATSSSTPVSVNRCIVTIF